MNDTQMVQIARKIETINHKVADLIYEVESSDHPNAEAAAQDLVDQCHALAWATHVIHTYLEHPEQWETGDFGIRRKRKK
jgi:hypothetical protein